MVGPTTWVEFDGYGVTDIPFIDTLDPAYDADIHAAHHAARERSWYARTPTGLLLLRYRDVHASLRWRTRAVGDGGVEVAIEGKAEAVLGAKK